MKAWCPGEEAQLQDHPPYLKAWLHLITLSAKQLISRWESVLYLRKAANQTTGLSRDWEFSSLNIASYKYKWLLSSRGSLPLSDLWRIDEVAKSTGISSGEHSRSPNVFIDNLQIWHKQRLLCPSIYKVLGEGEVDQRGERTQKSPWKERITFNTVS